MLAATQNLALAHSNGWKARLEVSFAEARGRTILKRVRHEGPLRVQRAFYPEADGTCHVYVLHPPGGVVQGDELAMSIDVDCGSRCLMTTPGATKIYRGEEQVSQVSTTIRVAAAGRCEWLPQETIVFCGAQLATRTLVELEPSASFIGWDVVCLGRPAAGERFTHGALSSQFTVMRAGVALLGERLRVDGSAPLLDAAWGMRGLPALGTLVLAVPERQWVDLARAQLESACNTEVVVVGTELEGISVFRALGASTELVKRALANVWHCCRVQLGTDGNHWPRIWAS